MIGHCRQHRPYLDAIADGEDARVPVDIRTHVDRCPVCRSDLATLTRLSIRVRAAIRPQGPPRPRAAGLVLAVAVILTAGPALAGLRSDADSLVGSVMLAASAPQFASRDAAAIHDWCAAASGWLLPIDTVPFTPRGARMDRIGEREVVTVSYEARGGRAVQVSWVGREPARDSSIQAFRIDGRLALLVRSAAGMAIVDGTATDSRLWEAARSLASMSR